MWCTGFRYHVARVTSGRLGHSGRCFNDCLRERTRNVRNGNEGFLAQHVSGGSCHTQFQNTLVMHKQKDDRTCEFTKAENMVRQPDTCVSKLSFAILDKELQFLANGAHRTRQ